MRKSLSPSSSECDCGHHSDFFENMVKGMKKLSAKKGQYLSDTEVEEDTIVFYEGGDGGDHLSKEKEASSPGRSLTKA